LQIDLNTIVGIMTSTLLAILIAQVRASRKESKAISDKLDAHILEMTKALAQKVDIIGCKGIRADCVSLNKKIIADPLDKALQDIEQLRERAWEQQRQENRALWMAIRGHSHTEMAGREKDKVILPQSLNSGTGGM